MSSLESALSILDLLGPDRPTLRVSEVCRVLDLPKSSVSRLLRTLATSGLIDREPDGSYAAGARAIGLATLYQARHPLRQKAERVLDALVEQFGCTGFVSALAGAEIVLLHVRQGSHPLRYVRDQGTRLPACQTAMGHVLLARLPEPAVRAHLQGVPNLDLAHLLQDLERIRQQGFLRIGSVLTQGATTIAAAIDDPASREPLALALAYADPSVDAATQAAMTEAILAAARTLETPSGD